MSLSRPRRRFLSLVASYCLVCAVLGVFLAESTLHPTKRPLTSEEQTWARAAAARQGVKLESVSMTTQDGAILYAWNLQSSANHAPAVILLHGMGDNRSGMVGYGELLLKHGFSVLLPDSRAHGESGGKVATYGLLEREDILDWFDWLRQNQQPPCIFGLGESMGAAQLLQAIQTEPGFCAVVAESPFSSFREIAYDRVGQFFRTGSWVGRSILRPVVESAFLYTRWRYGFNMDHISPRDAVAGSHVPILLIHGAVDGNIPVRHSRLIQSRNRAASLWEVPGADHCGAVSTAPAEFETRVTSWFSLDAVRDGSPTSTTAHPHPRSLASAESFVASRKPASSATGR